VQKGKIRSLPPNKNRNTKTIASPEKEKKNFCDGAGNNGSASGPTPNFVKRKG